MRLESAIQAQIIKKLKKRKNSFTHKHCPDPAGYPDIEHLENGKLYLFEVKRSENHKPTELQLLRHRQLEEAGATVSVVWSWDQVKEILQ